MSSKSRHISTFSSASIDLDVEGGVGSSLADDYDFKVGSLWSAKGPAVAVDQNPRVPLGHHLDWARKGWVDANRWPHAARLVLSSPPLRTSLLKGLLLSSILVGLIFFFELAFFPSHLFSGPGSEKDADKGFMGSLESTFFLYPLVGGTYMLAAQWSTDVATAAYTAQHGHNRGMSDVTLPTTTSRKVLLESYRIFLILNYTVICLILERIPFIGRTLGFLFMSLVDGYYCFEMGWVARGWSVERRMRFVESRWAYFLAFGLPSTFVSFFHPSGLLNLGLFMLVFPFCTVLAMLASPQPKSSPSSSTTSVLSPTSSSSGFGGPKLALFAPSRIPVFWPTVKLYRLLLKFFPPPHERATTLGDANGRWNANSGKGAGMGGYGTMSSSFEMGSSQPGMSQTSNFSNSNGQTGGSLGRKTAAQFLNNAWGGEAKAGVAMGVSSLGASNGSSWGNGSNPGTPPIRYQPPSPGKPQGWLTSPPKGPARFSGKKQD